MTELPQDQIISGEREYEAALDIVIAAAQRQLLIFDQDLRKGDYASAQRCEALRHFLGQSRDNRLCIILNDSQPFSSDFPRLQQLLQTYGHAMTVYQTQSQAQSARDCFVVADGKAYVRRFHIDQARFRYVLDDPDTAAALHSRFDELLQATSHSVTVSALGL